MEPPEEQISKSFERGKENDEENAHREEDTGESALRPPHVPSAPSPARTGDQAPPAATMITTDTPPPPPDDPYSP
jgi:hypothetical protein